MMENRYKRGGFAWLELLLALAFLALLFQVFPSLWFGLWAALDVRNWSRAVWFAANIVVIVALFGVRFAPEVAAGIRARRMRLARRRGKTQAATAEQPIDADDEARARQQTEWVERAKKRMPWHT